MYKLLRSEPEHVYSITKSTVLQVLATYTLISVQD